MADDTTYRELAGEIYGKEIVVATTHLVGGMSENEFKKQRYELNEQKATLLIKKLTDYLI